LPVLVVLPVFVVLGLSQLAQEAVQLVWAAGQLVPA
jgi:hypothetical protein